MATNIFDILTLIKTTIEAITPTRDATQVFQQALDMTIGHGRANRNFTVDIIGSEPVDRGAVRRGTGIYIQDISFTVSVYYDDKNSSIESNAAIIEDGNSIVQALYNVAGTTYRPLTSDGFRWNGSDIGPAEHGGKIQVIGFETRITDVT